MIRKENLTDLLRKPRKIEGPESGFGSKLPRHDAKYDQRFFDTANCDFYGKRLQLTAREIVKDHQQTLAKIAGSDPPPKNKERTNFPLVSEAMRKST